MKNAFRQFLVFGLGTYWLSAVAGCEVNDNDSCEDGDSRCASLYDIEYCREGTWSNAESCPPLNGGDGFEITTVCDEGICRP